MAAVDEVTKEIFSDHEVQHPPHHLRKAITTTGKGSAIDLNAIARAEKALAALAVEFSTWMNNEIKVLEAARDIVRNQGLVDETRAALFRAAHDVKGEASTFGYPLAGRIATSLCRLIDDIEAHGAIPLPLVDQHVDAIRAIVREDVKGDGDTVSRMVAERLEEAPRQVVAKVNKAS